MLEEVPVQKKNDVWTVKAFLIVFNLKLTKLTKAIACQKKSLLHSLIPMETQFYFTKYITHSLT